MSRVAQQALLSSIASPAVLAYQGFTTAPPLTTPVLTATSCPIGPASGSRIVFCRIHWMSTSAARALSSATIGGVAATIHTQVTVAGNASYYLGTAVISAAVPTGTTADVVMTFASGSTIYAFAASYSVTGLLSLTPGDTISAAASGVNPYSGTIDVVKLGFLLFGATVYSTATGYTVAGATEDYESSIGSNFKAVGASLAVAANETNRAVSITRTGGSGTGFNGAVVGDAFR